jgi:hypothetical protein
MQAERQGRKRERLLPRLKAVAKKNIYIYIF